MARRCLLGEEGREVEGRGGGGMLLSETVHLEKEIETDPLISLSVEKSIIPPNPTRSVPLPFYSPARKGKKTKYFQDARASSL